MKPLVALIICLFCVHSSFGQFKEKRENVQMPAQVKAGDRLFEHSAVTGRKGTQQRHPQDAGIDKIIQRIPSKTHPIVIEVYRQDPESVTLQNEIKEYLIKKGYTDVKAI